ncbi:MAG: hypothetical protein HOC70_00575 [Gammaproteobacteria bacterium]|jgi:hypothetical protein|nr:hypothetical protein [Gammaproteobacteria bacterium]
MYMNTNDSGWNKSFEMDEGLFWRTLVKGGQASWGWTTKDGSAVLAIVSPVCVNGDIYLTTIEGRAKTNRLLRDPRCTLTIHTDWGSVTAIGHVEFDKRPTMVAMFLEGLQERVFGGMHEESYIHFRHMNSPDRWTCKFIAEKYVTFDEEKFLAG